jgi:TetR/AcrR family transcriptional regulator
VGKNRKARTIGNHRRVPEAESSRERLLESATIEFAEKGLAGARVNEIAARAGINKQLVYHYFQSKERLYGHVLARALAKSRDRDGELAIDGLDPANALKAFIDHLILTSLVDRQYQRLMVDANAYEGRHLDELDIPTSLLSERVTILTRILSSGAKKGVFRQGLDARELYISIIGIFSIRMTNAYSLSRTLGADLLTEEGRKRSRQYALDTLLFGINAK